MKRSIYFLSLLSLAALMTSCGPGKDLQRYRYLTEDIPRTSRTERPATPPNVSERPERESRQPVSESTGSVYKSAGTLSPSEVEIIVSTALSYQGTPYKYGGMSRTGMDCSGLMCTSYKAANRSLPRTTSALSAEGKRVSLSKVRPGHILLFSAKGNGRIDHAGLVVAGEGDELNFIHATTSRGVRIDKLDSYWEPRLQKAVAF